MSHKLSTQILWLLIAIYAWVTVLADGLPRLFASPYTLPLSIIVPLLFGLIHGALRYGITGIVVFLVLCLGISNVMENVGVMTGFPFGHYHYTDVLGPKLFLVPLLIGPAYFGTGYVSWVLALDFPASYLAGENKPVTDATGKIWQTGDMYQTASIVSLYTMLFVAVASFAVLLLGRGPRATEAA